MTTAPPDPRTHTDLLDSMEQVLRDAGSAAHDRRTLMARASGLLAVGAALALPGMASAAPEPKGHDNSPISVLTTFEAFGVTLLTAAVKQANGTASEPFKGVLAAANTAEYLHLEALRKRGGAPLTTKFWIPDAILDGGAGLFDAIAKQEEVEISAYLVGVTSATKNRNPKLARLYAEALSTESEHRVLARYASATIRGKTTTDVPNNHAFAAYTAKSAKAALSASQGAGIGYGKQTSAPGKFYEYPGDPSASGTGGSLLSRQPA